jgi:site-specific DNA-methyltransferase (adenine-specific)
MTATHVVHLGDCIEGLRSLPDKSVGVVLTDPPYSARVHAGKGSERRNDGGKIEALDFGCLTARDRLTLAREFVRVGRRWIVTFCDEESVFLWMAALVRAGAEWCCKGTWVKEGAAPRMDGTRPAYGTEAICIAHAPLERGCTRWNGGGKVATYSASIQEAGREHPTQKPLALMEALVRDFTDPGETVLDPFAGSGTTGVACKRLGRSFIGWERDPKYHAIAVKRIEAAREQLGLRLGPKPAREKQSALLLPELPP